jgi:hypothetical protein
MQTKLTMKEVAAIELQRASDRDHRHYVPGGTPGDWDGERARMQKSLVNVHARRRHAFEQRVAHVVKTLRGHGEPVNRRDAAELCGFTFNMMGRYLSTARERGELTMTRGFNDAFYQATPAIAATPSQGRTTRR